MRKSATCVPAFYAVFIFTLLFSGCEHRDNSGIHTEIVKVDSLDQIQLLENSFVKPVIYTHISGLEHLPVPKAKAKFIAAILPSILIAKHQIERYRGKIEVLKAQKEWTETDSTFYGDMLKRYKAKTADELIFKMRTMPNSIVLAQAAIESGWGQSRFFIKANNLFGIWSFNANEPRMVAARLRGNSKKIYLRSYQDMTQSIVHYFEILSRSKAYRSLRKARLETTDPIKLLPHLKNFSERRHAYLNQVENVIVLNKLKHYDNYQIDPKYLLPD